MKKWKDYTCSQFLNEIFLYVYPIGFEIFPASWNLKYHNIFVVKKNSRLRVLLLLSGWNFIFSNIRRRKKHTSFLRWPNLHCHFRSYVRIYFYKYFSFSSITADGKVPLIFFCEYSTDRFNGLLKILTGWVSRGLVQLYAPALQRKW